MDGNRGREATEKVEAMSVNFETVRGLALQLPGAEDGLSYGAPAVKVNGKLIIRWREDLNAIVLKNYF